MTEFLLVIAYCLIQLATHSKVFILTLVVAIFLATMCWIACTFYTRLWNLHFRLTKIHHVLCAVAALLTLLFTFVFVSLQYTQQVSVNLIDFWKNEQIKTDHNWQQATFHKTYEAVKALNIEDFSNYPHPDEGGHLFPSSQAQSREVTATIYATESIKHFQANHPYLSKILWAGAEIPTQIIHQDNNTYLDLEKGDVYPLDRAVDLAANYITQGLIEQTTRVVKTTRIIIIILFLIIQAIPLSFIGYSAYKDIKEIT